MNIKAKWGFCNFLMTFRLSKGNKCVSNMEDDIYLRGPTNMLDNTTNIDNEQFNKILDP